jgi:hypothetical protein
MPPTPPPPTYTTHTERHRRGRARHRARRLRKGCRQPRSPRCVRGHLGGQPHVWHDGHRRCVVCVCVCVCGVWVRNYVLDDPPQSWCGPETQPLTCPLPPTKSTNQPTNHNTRRHTCPATRRTRLSRDGDGQRVQRLQLLPVVHGESFGQQRHRPGRVRRVR